MNYELRDAGIFENSMGMGMSNVGNWIGHGNFYTGMGGRTEIKNQLRRTSKFIMQH